MSQKNIRFGVIGAAKIANKFCEAVKIAAGNTCAVEVLAVASNTPGKAKDFAEKNLLECWYDSYDALLARDDIDAVYIATTHNFHKENIMQSLRAGKHVLCEKPFVLHESDAAEIFSFAREKGLFCMEAMWSRFLPTIQTVKTWVDSGKIGTVELANFTIGFHAEEDPTNRMYNPELAGGAIYDIGVYAFEITDFVIPEPLKQVHSVVTWADTGVDKTDSITLVYGNCVAHLQCAMSSSLKQELNLFGKNGRIYVADPHHSSAAELYDAKGELVERFSFPLTNGFEFEVAEMVCCIQEGRIESDIMPHSTTLRCARLFDECLIHGEA